MSRAWPQDVCLSWYKWRRLLAPKTRFARLGEPRLLRRISTRLGTTKRKKKTAKAERKRYCALSHLSMFRNILWGQHSTVFLLAASTFLNTNRLASMVERAVRKAKAYPTWAQTPRRISSFMLPTYYLLMFYSWQSAFALHDRIDYDSFWMLLHLLHLC